VAVSAASSGGTTVTILTIEMPVPNTNAANSCRCSPEPKETVMSRNIYRFPIEERIKLPARKFDEPAIIYYLANERIERGLAQISNARATHK
jgi:hypothetical protein